MTTSQKRIAVGVGALLVGFVVYIGGWFYFGIYGHRGSAANTQALARVYQADDPNLAAFYGKSFLHKICFIAPIQWHREVWRPSVTLTSQVDVVAFRRD